MQRLFRPLAAGLVSIALCACDTPPVSPGLDITCLDAKCQPGVIQGNVVYNGPRRGDVVLLLFDINNLPPPDGQGTSAASVARIPAAALFAGAASGPFSAPYTFTSVQAGTYQVRAFLDAAHSFDPFFDFTQQPRAGDPVGGYLTFDGAGQPHLAAVTVTANTAVTGVNVALGPELPYDPPSFTILPGPGGQPFSLVASNDRPSVLTLQAKNLGVDRASFGAAHFGVELAPDAQGNPVAADGDGIIDVFPRVILRQLDAVNGDGTLSAVSPDKAAVIPCKVISIPFLPQLLQRGVGAGPIAVDTIQVLVEPFAIQLLQTPFGQAQRFQPRDSVPPGHYQVVVVEKSGQVWTVPNSLGDPAAKAQESPWYADSQGQTVEVKALPIVGGGISGTITGPGASGNILVQAYLDDPANPPPPLGVAQPVRVQVIPQYLVAKQGRGFKVSYALTGLPPGNYLVRALADADGNFSPLNLLQTPTRGDLIGLYFDTSGNQDVTVQNGVVSGIDVQTAIHPGQDLQGNGTPQDPPGFVLDGAAQIAQDARGTVRFGIKSSPIPFPTGAATQWSPAQPPFFTVQLVRKNGATVDSDGDGLPDVWPRVFLVQLDPTDPSGLTQATPTVVIPAAVDPTPFLPALLANPNGLAQSKLSIIVRPAAINVSTPSQPQRLPAMPAGRYKVVVMNATGEVWQIPNEAGPAALDPGSANILPTQSQSQAFTVLPPAQQPPTGSISGNLQITGLPTTGFVRAYVFAFSAQSPPPPRGLGRPLSADLHAAAEFQSGVVAYTLPALPRGDYLITAVVDTRGDFALDPGVFAFAPGQGDIVGGHFDAKGALAPVHVETGPTTGQNVIASGALATVGPRPSFGLVDASDNPLSSDVAGPGQVSATPVRLRIHADALLGSGVAAIKPETTAGFQVSFLGCDANGVPLDLDEDNLPDVYPVIRLVKLSEDDPSGLTPEPSNTVIPAVVDPTPYLQTLTCTGATAAVSTSSLNLVVSPAAVRPQPDGSIRILDSIPAGRYGLFVISAQGQVWRIPNELAGAAALAPDDGTPASLAKRLARQQLSVRVAPAPQSISGSIPVTLHLSGYQPVGSSSGVTVGNLILAATPAGDPPPPFGTGRPVAARLIPRSLLSLVTSSGTLPLSFPGLTPGASYYLSAILDGQNRFSGGISVLATPPIGAQVQLAGGLPPQALTAVAAGGTATATDVFFDALAPLPAPLPFERPVFAVDPTGGPAVLPPSPPQVVNFTLKSTPLPAIGWGAFATAASGLAAPAFHVALQTDFTGVPRRGPDGRFLIWPKVILTPLDPTVTTGLVPLAFAEPSPYCAALTSNGDCKTGTPNTPPGTTLVPSGSLLVDVVPGGFCVDLGSKSVVPCSRPPSGAYAITVVELTGQTWTLPNELAQLAGQVGVQQRGVFVVQ